MHRRRKKYRKLLDWEKCVLLGAYKAGDKLEALSEEFGVVKTTITKLARKNGLPPRPETRLRSARA